MSDLSNHRQRKDSISGLLFVAGAIFEALAFLANLVAVVPAVSQNASWLPSLCGAFVIAGILVIIIAACLWGADRMDAIDKYIENSKKLNETIESANKRLETVSKIQQEIQTTHQNLAGETGPVLQAVQGQMKQMENVMSRHSNFRYSTGEVTKLLEDFVAQHLSEITEVHIICFGRNGYEQAINYIVEKCRNISVKVIFCNTKKNGVICRKEDDNKIKETMKGLLKKCGKWNTEIEILVSDIPPAIRASIVYAGEKRAVWGAIQSYNFEWEADQLTLVRPEKSLIIVGDDKSVKSDFDGIISSIEAEFDRLEDSVKLKAFLEGDEVRFSDVERSDVKRSSTKRSSAKRNNGR